MFTSKKLKSELDATLPKEATSQGNPFRRQNWPMWARQLPTFADPKPSDDNYQLVNPAQLDIIMQSSASATPGLRAELEEDLKVLNAELMRLFRYNDLQAKIFQNRYRLTQLGFIALAFLATFFGSIQAVVMLGGSRNGVAILAFMEAAIALFATFLATTNSTKQQLTEWLSYRQRSELLRREYFRYLTRIAPYEGLSAVDREELVAQRAASINKGDLTSEDL